MNIWIDGQMDGWTNKGGYMNGKCINGQIDGWMFIELNSLQMRGNYNS